MTATPDFRTLDDSPQVEPIAFSLARAQQSWSTTPEMKMAPDRSSTLGGILCMKEAQSLFPPGGGSIINISSAIVRASPPTTGIYSASKAALNAITKVVAKELGPRNIRVNAISPGAVATEGTHSAGLFSGEWEAQLVAMTPLGRMGRPTDITPMALFLASEEGSWVTGRSCASLGVTKARKSPFPSAPRGPHLSVEANDSHVTVLGERQDGRGAARCAEHLKSGRVLYVTRPGRRRSPR